MSGSAVSWADRSATSNEPTAPITGPGAPIADMWRELIRSGATGASLADLHGIDQPLAIARFHAAALEWARQLNGALERVRTLTVGSWGLSTAVDALADVDIVIGTLDAATTAGSAKYWKVLADFQTARQAARSATPAQQILTGSIERAIHSSPPAASSVAETPATAVTPERARARSPDFQAFNDLCRWLNLTDEEAARVVGVRRTTPYAWERDGTRPRPETARRMYQIHAAIAALVQRYGEEEAMRFLLAGARSPAALLMDGDPRAAMRAIEDKVFAGPHRTQLDAWTPEPDESTPPQAGASPTVRFTPRRRRRRTRPGD